MLRFLCLLLSSSLVSAGGDDGFVPLLRGAIDLTYDTLQGKVVSPWGTNFKFNPGFQFEVTNRGPFGPNNIYLETNKFSQGEHFGTHMDAPRHFSNKAENWRAHEIPLERLAGEAVVIDITEKASKNRDATVDVEDLTRWEEEYGRIPDGAVVVMYSGWGEKYSNNTNKYIGMTAEDFEAAGLNFGQSAHYPGFSEDAARWLVENRVIHGVATDTMSLDHAPATHFPAHIVLLGANIWGLENTANVHMLRPKGDLIIAAPYKLYNGSGGPTRAFALPADTYRKRVGATANAGRRTGSNSFQQTFLALLAALRFLM